jgi:arylsulfatase A-like enzyme
MARPSYAQASYRFLNKPFKRLAPRSAIERYLLPELSDTVEVGRLRSLVGWNSINRHREKDYAAARVVRSGMNLVDDLKRKQPFFLGIDCFDPHEAFEPPKVFMDRFGPAKGVAARNGIEPIQPFETPYSWVIRVDLDDETIERVRDLYAAELTFVDSWIGRFMNKLADENLLDSTVIIYASDHGLTLGEDGVIGKDPARANWPIYHVPHMIRHPEGRRAGETSDYFATTTDIPKTLLSFMGIRAPGMMNGEDLSVLFDGKEPPPRPVFTSMYERYVLAGDGDWFMIADSKGAIKRLFDKNADPNELKDVASEHPQIVDRLWRVLEDEAGGTLPQFSGAGVIGG